MFVGICDIFSVKYRTVAPNALQTIGRFWGNATMCKLNHRTTNQVPRICHVTASGDHWEGGNGRLGHVVLADV